MIVASLSQLSIRTATELGNYTAPKMRVLLSMDNCLIFGDGSSTLETFVYEEFNFSLHYGTNVTFDDDKNAHGKALLTLRVDSRQPADWELLCQMRIRIGKEDAEQTEVVDRFVIDFHPNNQSLTIAVKDETIHFVKFEMRLLKKVFWLHPSFEEGDVDIVFANETCFRTTTALLALASIHVERGYLPINDIFPEVLREFLLFLQNHRRIANFDLLSKATAFFRFPSTWTQPDYFNPVEFTRCITFRGTNFYVNNTILEGTNSEVVFSKEMEQACRKLNAIPGRIFVSLLNSLHPGGPSVDVDYLQPAIILCHDNRWPLAKQNLESDLLLEPAQSAQQFLEQILFAERYQLDNMLRTCLFRAESSHIKFTSELTKNGFPGVSSKTQCCLLDRLCSGWSFFPKVVNPLAIRHGTEAVDREISAKKGGPVGAEQDPLTMADVFSDELFGSLTEFEVQEGFNQPVF